MTPEAREVALGVLIPEGTYRSPQLPTLSLGIPAYVVAFSPQRRKPVGLSEAPSRWMAIDARSGDISVFANTSVHTPVRDFAPGPIPVVSGSMSPPDAFAQLRLHWKDASAAFFAGQPAEAAVASAMAEALDSAIVPRLSAWLRLCCADFFAWLDASRNG